MLRKPYLLFLGDAQHVVNIKTALGLRDWCGDDVIGECALPACKLTLGFAKLDPAVEQQALIAKTTLAFSLPVIGPIKDDADEVAWLLFDQMALG